MSGSDGHRLGMDHLGVILMTLLLGGSVIARVGQYTAAQAGPAVVLSLLLAALGAALVLACLYRVVTQADMADGLHGLLVAGWGRSIARVLCLALLLECTATLAGAAQSGAGHLHAALAAGASSAGTLPVQVTAAAGLLLLGATALMRPARTVLLVCGLLTVKIGIGVLLLALAARYVHYAHWIPWVPPATAPYRFGLGGVLAAAVPLLGIFASAGLALGVPGLPVGGLARRPLTMLMVLVAATLMLIALAALQAGLVDYPALASSRPLTVALRSHPQLSWMLPWLPLAGYAGLAALQLVLLMLATRLALPLWPLGNEGDPPAACVATVAIILLATLLALWLPAGVLPTMPGPVGLLVVAALCLGGLQRRSEVTRSPADAVLGMAAAALCLLPLLR
ncbi:amino acid transporter [Stenotrophomonas maltophilia]|uniref:amino acid transporter n=1 Tax=Stenotrophomonas maltophilia TaxID=40324 RepID=UPI0039C0CDC7